MMRYVIALAFVFALAGSAEASPARQCIQWQASGAHAFVQCPMKAKERARRRAPFRSLRAHVHHRVHRQHGSSGFVSGWPKAWCGAWMALRKGFNDRRLWLAAAWARVGSAATGPAPGVIGVMRHHVYEVVEVISPGRVLAISGNDGHAVRTRIRSTRGTIAWRWV